MYVVLSGTLEVRLETTDGHCVGTLEKGDCAGEMSVFDNSDPSAWVVSRNQVRVLPIAKNTALAMMHASHDLCLNLLHILAQRLRINNRNMNADKHHIRRVEETAMVDALTGLHNRRWMQDMFKRELERSHIGNQPLTCLLMDIDHFKKVNDEHGHLAGDTVLAVIAQVTTLALRPTDMVVRYGGEEIIVLLPNTRLEDGIRVAERIRQSVECRAIDLPESGYLRVTISIGVSERQSADTLTQLIDRADKALYQAKNSGRNRIEAEP